jgi:hypothetical protein
LKKKRIARDGGNKMQLNEIESLDNVPNTTSNNFQNNTHKPGKGNVPEKRFSVNGITATVWKNEGTNKSGETIYFRTITFEKNYKDKEGQWKNTNTLRSNDVPKASLVLNKAYEYMMMAAN